MPIILIVIGIILIVFNYISIKKESSSFEIKDMQELRKESSFNSVLEKSKDELNDYKNDNNSVVRRKIDISLTDRKRVQYVRLYENINCW